MNTTYTDAPEVQAVVRAAFPRECISKGHLQVAPFHPVTPSSYWSGGSRDYWAFVRLVDMTPSDALPESGSGFVPDAKRIETLPQGFALVRVTRRNGPSLATVYLHPSDLTPMLPPSTTLSPDEELVVVITASLKSFARLEEAYRCGMTSARWNAAKASCIAQGLLNKAGAITTEGRNARTRIAGVGSHWLYSKHISGRY